MSRAHLVTAMVAVALSSLLAVSRAKEPSTRSRPGAAAQNAPTEVVIVGTIHGLHLKRPIYSPEVLREIVLALNPSAILNELPLDQVETDGRPKSREYGDPEGWASDQVASRLRVPQVPFDRPDRSEYYARTGYFQKQYQVNAWLRKWLETAEKQSPDSADLQCVRFLMETHGVQVCFFKRPSPEFINSDVFDRLMYLKHVKTPPVLLAIFKKYPDFTPQVEEDMKFLEKEWVERNSIMAQSIERAARQYPGGRLVVLTGAEHRYALRDLLGEKDGIALKEYWEVTDVDLGKVLPSRQRKAWKAQQNRLLADSAAVCRQYWQAVIQGNWDDASKLYPARGADHIKREYSRTRPVAIVRIESARMSRPDEGTTNPVTPCIIKYESGKMEEIRMCTRLVNDKCIIVATLGLRRAVTQEEADRKVTWRPSHE